MLVESSGQAHNDPVMLLLSTLGIWLAIAGGVKAIRGGLVLVTMLRLTGRVLRGVFGPPPVTLPMPRVVRCGHPLCRLDGSAGGDAGEDALVLG